jgi:hypothetical protein
MAMVAMLCSILIVASSSLKSIGMTSSARKRGARSLRAPRRRERDESRAVGDRIRPAAAGAAS